MVEAANLRPAVGPGDTLERRLLDAGARVWPVQTEVHLYETLPGTQLGHLAAFEGEQGVWERRARPRSSSRR